MLTQRKCFGCWWLPGTSLLAGWHWRHPTSPKAGLLELYLWLAKMQDTPDVVSSFNLKPCAFVAAVFVVLLARRDIVCRQFSEIVKSSLILECSPDGLSFSRSLANHY